MVLLIAVIGGYLFLSGSQLREIRKRIEDLGVSGRVMSFSTGGIAHRVLFTPEVITWWSRNHSQPT